MHQLPAPPTRCRSPTWVAFGDFHVAESRPVGTSLFDRGDPPDLHRACPLSDGASCGDPQDLET